MTKKPYIVAKPAECFAEHSVDVGSGDGWQPDCKDVEALVGFEVDATVQPAAVEEARVTQAIPAGAFVVAVSGVVAAASGCDGDGPVG